MPAGHSLRAGREYDNCENSYRDRNNQGRSETEKAARNGRMWVVSKNEFYHKETGRRHFAENTRRRLLLETIEAIGGSHD